VLVLAVSTLPAALVGLPVVALLVDLLDWLLGRWRAGVGVVAAALTVATSSASAAATSTAFGASSACCTSSSLAFDLACCSDVEVLALVTGCAALGGLPVVAWLLGLLSVRLLNEELAWAGVLVWALVAIAAAALGRPSFAWLWGSLGRNALACCGSLLTGVLVLAVSAEAASTECSPCAAEFLGHFLSVLLLGV